MYDLLKEFIKPELLILVPVLYLVGIALKRSAVADKHIPWILGAAGVVLSYLWIAGTCRMANAQEIVLAVFTGLVQGILAAGASVYCNQIVKQAGKE
jgi:hypothetical protein